MLLLICRKGFKLSICQTRPLNDTASLQCIFFKKICGKKIGFGLGWLLNHLIRAHHFVVFVVEDVAVPDVSRPSGRIKGIGINSWSRSCYRSILWRISDDDAVDLDQQQILIASPP